MEKSIYEIKVKIDTTIFGVSDVQNIQNIHTIMERYFEFNRSTIVTDAEVMVEKEILPLLNIVNYEHIGNDGIYDVECSDDLVILVKVFSNGWFDMWIHVEFREINLNNLTQRYK